MLRQKRELNVMIWLKSWLSRNPFLFRGAKKAKYYFRQPKAYSFVTYEEGFALASQWAEHLPKDFDCIIGIPRNGLMIASVLASKMGKPLSTTDDFARGIVWYSKDVEKPTNYQKVLLVEDAVNEGRSMQRDYDSLRKLCPDLIIKRASLFAKGNSTSWLDYYYLSQSLGPMEWNLLTSMSAIYGKVAVEMDGVLCQDCFINDTQEPEKYVTWLSSVEPLLLPAYPIEAIITSRIERYRPATELWLKLHNVKYNKLIMFNAEQPEEKTFKNVAHFKANNAINVGAKWFWESSFSIAKEIARLTQIPVYCVETHQVLMNK
jgi:hypoxanthine phosphoribosyltransferase